MNISFEFFPPKTEQGRQTLQQVSTELATLKPEYFSVTFGAGGTTPEATRNTVADLTKTLATPIAPHLSCIHSKKSELIHLLDNYQTQDITRLVVIRGDIPLGAQTIGTFKYANELVAFIKSHYANAFHIEVAAYPEMHPQAHNIHSDLAHFVNKVKAGADGAITQYFYNPEGYFRFRDEVHKLGVDIPITAGIMPITNYTQLTRFSNLCGAEIPRWILTRLEYYQNDADSLAKFGEEVVMNLCQTLKNQGVDQFHFYSLNRAAPSFKLAQQLQVL